MSRWWLIRIIVASAAVVTTSAGAEFIDAPLASSSSSSSFLRKTTTPRQHGVDIDSRNLSSADASTIAVSTRIAGGRNVVRGRYPYFVALFDKFDAFRCGGSLIAPNIVLSAAHCQDRLEYAVVGLYSETDASLGDNDDDVSERINIVGRYPHPLWNLDDYSNDQMILTLERASIHSPVRLNLDPEIPTPNSNVTLIGIGKFDGSPDRPDTVQETTSLKFIENGVCQNFTDERSGNQPFDGRITEEMICVYDSNASQCNGDSGGPFLITPTDNPEDDIQIGLVSWSYGLRCGRFPVKWPGVGSRTSSSEWIQAVTCEYATTAPFNFFCNFVDWTLSSPPTQAPFPFTTSPDLSVATVTLVLTLYLDGFPHEISWVIVSVATGSVIKEVPTNTYIKNTTMIREEIQVPPGEYRLVLEDSAGDGIDTSQTGDGIAYEIIVFDESLGAKFLLLQRDGSFQGKRTNRFTVPEPENYPSASPTIAPSVSLAPTMTTVTVYLRFDFDDWHKEISWVISSPPADGGDDIIWASVEPGAYIFGGVITEEIQLPVTRDGDFVLFVRDSFGDGFVGDEPGNGYFLFLKDPLSGREIILVEGDGNIGSERIHPFSIKDWIGRPSEAPHHDLVDIEGVINVSRIDLP